MAQCRTLIDLMRQSVVSHGSTEREDTATGSVALRMVQYSAMPALVQRQPSDASTPECAVAACGFLNDCIGRVAGMGRARGQIKKEGEISAAGVTHMELVLAPS